MFHVFIFILNPPFADFFRLLGPRLPCVHFHLFLLVFAVHLPFLLFLLFLLHPRRRLLLLPPPFLPFLILLRLLRSRSRSQSRSG